jgi:polyvinyl alcohol dehydrogenase (cytochrome)
MRPALFALCLAAVLALGAGPPAAASSALGGGGRPGDWAVGGQNLSDTRSNPFVHAISPRSASRLALKWTAQTHGDVSSTPAVVDGAVYLTDWGGFLTKLDAATGQVIWSHPVSDYDGIPGSISRTSPLVADGRVFIGDMNDTSSPVLGGLGAHDMAIDARTGALIWSALVDDQGPASITASPIVYRGVVYQGVSSKEEAMATVPTYPCCVFRGSEVALSEATGAILWRTFVVPDNGGQPGGYSGAAIWSTTPAIDPATSTLYLDTGNNYTVPASVTACQSAGGTPAACLSPDDHIDSIMALDLRTGRIKWATGRFAFDSWTAACLQGQSPVNCPPNAGDDSDFGAGVNLFTVRDAAGRTRKLVGAGQHSGTYWALDAATGAIEWATAAGPSGLQGGIQWGTATDGRRIYVAESNDQRKPHTLPDGQTIDFGSVAALDAATGRILWQTPDPTGNLDKSALSVANGVVFAGSMSGHMYALDAATGQVLFDFLGQGSSIAGPAIVGDSVYWGNGYSHFAVGTPSTTFYAFTIRQ